MERNRAQVVQYLGELEGVAEDILSDRQHLVELDKKRQDTRVALRKIKTSASGPDDKHYVCFGKMFIKMPNSCTSELLDRDYKNIEKEIIEVRDGLKVKMNKMRDIEQKPALKGFDLKAMSSKEHTAMSSILNKT